MWSGVKPNISHLRPFGCAAYVHVSQVKLQPKALKCVMLGYPEGVKGYKLLVVQPGADKCIVSRDVTFNECDFPFKRTDTVLSKSADASDGNFFESLDNDDSANEEDHSGILHNAAYEYSESETEQNDNLNGGEQVVVSSDSQGETSVDVLAHTFSARFKVYSLENMCCIKHNFIMTLLITMCID
ncbi:unnamed protein product [Cuscuta europaea]|uniref:Retroviral polymerase SH3-like domain-containing protein n=1 Tax=Cuscuta europaea TaxID=41803 RepID=A0A9P1E8P1_CUSEU|nr:unnamed protein product [Cuscuta europaea]